MRVKGEEGGGGRKVGEGWEQWWWDYKCEDGLQLKVRT